MDENNPAMKKQRCKNPCRKKPRSLTIGHVHVRVNSVFEGKISLEKAMENIANHKLKMTDKNTSGD